MENNKSSSSSTGGGGAEEQNHRTPLARVVSDCAKRWFQNTLKDAKEGRIWMTRASRIRSSVWKDHWTIFLILCLASTRLGTTTSLKSNVMNYGAVGDGKTDDSQAFLKAWKAICQAKSVVPILVIPRMTFLLKPATFSGPCKSSNIYVQVLGNLVAPNTKWAWIGHHIDTWLTFSNVNGLSIIGQQGRIDSQGSAWRPLPCLQQRMYKITGALGHGGYDRVEGIHVSNCTFKGTMNGVRIKTWQGGNGYARKVSFENITLVQVNNPILIDQFYCPSRVDCQNKTSAVELSDISYSGIMGTSTADEVINLSCSQSGSGGSTDISLDCVYIASTIPGKKTYADLPILNVLSNAYCNS